MYLPATLRVSTNGRVAEWLGGGLQNLLQRFESARDLFKIVMVGTEVNQLILVDHNLYTSTVSVATDRFLLPTTAARQIIREPLINQTDVTHSRRQSKISRL